MISDKCQRFKDLTTSDKVRAFEEEFGRLDKLRYNGSSGHFEFAFGGNRINLILEIADLLRKGGPNQIERLVGQLLTLNVPLLMYRIVPQGEKFKVEQMPINLISELAIEIILDLISQGVCERCGASFERRRAGRPRKYCDRHVDAGKVPEKSKEKF